MLNALALRYRTRDPAQGLLHEREAATQMSSAQQQGQQQEDEDDEEEEEEGDDDDDELGEGAALALADKDKDKDATPAPAPAAPTPTPTTTPTSTEVPPQSPVQLHRVTTASGSEKIRRVRLSRATLDVVPPGTPVTAASSSSSQLLSADAHELAPEESPEEVLCAVVRYLSAQLEGSDAHRRAPALRHQTLALLHVIVEAQRRTPVALRGALLTRTLCDEVALCALQVVQRALQPYLVVGSAAAASPASPNASASSAPPPPPVPSAAELELLSRALRVLQALWEIHGSEQRSALDLTLSYVLNALALDDATALFPLAPELREVLLDALVSWARDTPLLHALVVHFDAQRRAASWAQRLVHMLAKTAESGPAALALCAQDALAALLRALHTRLREDDAGSAPEARARSLLCLSPVVTHDDAVAGARAARPARRPGSQRDAARGGAGVQREAI